MHLSLWDGLVFAGYFLLVIGVGFWVAARDKQKTAEEYFLARKKLPWYAVGASFIAANISTEHFIGMVGCAYLYGFAVAHWEWGNFITFSLLIWIFLPFYMRGNVATMPEFLERRYNRACRIIYALVSTIGMVVAMFGAVAYAGGLAMNALFPQISVPVGILLVVMASSLYTIYGGQLSVAWTDVMQYVLLLVGGAAVTVFCLYNAGDTSQMVAAMPEKFIMFFSPRHEMIPWTGLVAGIFSVGIWYSCANQFMVQRCLGARSEWDARMGIVMAGFSKAVLPLIIVLPGVVAFYIFHDHISNGDQSWPLLVKRFLPAGLIGLVMAGLASAIMSTISAILNSSATVLTLDLYKPLLNPQADDRKLRLVGRALGVAVMAIGTAVALYMTRSATPVFAMIQTVFFYVAAPIAAIFVIGILWPRATPAAGTVTLVVGFALIPVVRSVVFQHPALKPYDSFTHHTFVVFLISCALTVLVSLFTRPRPIDELRGVIWSRTAMGIPPEERPLNRGLRNLTLWWALMVILILGCYYLAMSFGSRTRLSEAESLVLTTDGGAARIQSRDEVAKTDSKFALWTGARQVLFESSKPEGRVTFTIPVDRAGRYEIGAVVTRGPEYADFRAFVNEQPVKLGWVRAKSDADGKRYRVVSETGDTFFGQRPADSAVDGGVAAGGHTVARVSLGEVELPAGAARVTLQAVGAAAGRSAIGVDQWMLTRVGKQTP